VILHVPRAEHAAWIDIFKSGHNFVGGFAGGVNHDVQAAAMAHGHDGFDGTVLADGIENGVEKWNQRSHTFERKALRAQIPGLQDLLEKVGTDQALEHFLLIDFAFGTFDAFGDPAAALRLGKVHELDADRSAINAAGFLGYLARQSFQVRLRKRSEKAEGIKIGFVIAPAAKRVEDALALLCASSGRPSFRCGLFPTLLRFRGAFCFEP
jgi:hypothetical protein